MYTCLYELVYNTSCSKILGVKISKVEVFAEYGGNMKIEEAIAQNIRREFRSRILAKGQFKVSTVNLVLCDRWNLSRKILM
jgi:hypothetical protein